MFSTCANPDCRAKFDYREGRFFRFHKEFRAGEGPPNSHSVQHFWLCGRCSGIYALKYEDSRGVVMLPRMEISGKLEASRKVAVA